MKTRIQFVKRWALAVLVFPVIAMACTAFGIVVAQATSPATPSPSSQPSGHPQLSGKTTLNLETVIAVFGVVLPATVWLSRRFTQFADKQDAMEHKISVVFSRLDELPCYRHGGVCARLEEEERSKGNKHETK